MWLVRNSEQIIGSLGFAAKIGFLSSAKHHNLIEADGLRMFESEDRKPIKLASQETCACTDCRGWNNEHQHALAGYPAIAVFEEYQFHSLVTVRSNFAIVRWIQVQKRAGFRQHPALKNTAVDGCDAIFGGCGCSVRIKFNAGQMSACVPSGLDQSGAIANTRINRRKGRGRHQQGADISGFLDRQRVVTEFDAASISHFSLRSVEPIQDLLKGRISPGPEFSTGFCRARCRT